MPTKNLVIFIAAILIAVFCAVGFFKLAPTAKPGNHFWSKLTQRINEGQTAISMRSLTDIEWDSVCILEPYSLGTEASREERIKEFIDGDLAEFRNKLPDLNDDGLWAFVFIHNGKAVGIAERGRGYYLYKRYKRNCMSKDEAIFNVDGKNIYITSIAGDY